jgi:hypothetical protein
MNARVEAATTARNITERKIDYLQELLRVRRPINAFGVYESRAEVVAMLRTVKASVQYAIDALHEAGTPPCDADYADYGTQNTA